MRVLFAGTPSIAVASLDALMVRHEVVGVLTGPDRPRGRGLQPGASPVAERALRSGIPLLTPESLGADARASVAALRPDLLASFAYGSFFGPRFLALFPRGGLNVHPSLLPRHRGPSPIEAAILCGDARTGVTVQALASELDAGDIYAQRVIPLDGTETGGALGAAAATVGAELLAAVVDAVEEGTAAPRPQDHASATWTRRIDKEDGLIDWRLPARQIERMVRAYTPWPRARTTLGARELAVLQASVVDDRGGDGPPVPGRVARVDTALGILVETTDGVLALRRLQLQTRKPLDWKSFLNGVPVPAGTVLGG